ncbi:hypothetical protein [Roseomonas cutis]|uniref:hypothetical protein n=1 Tax=Roseomonas cutis TaxID=2897332 RepID=UPI00272B6F13|nr:hypothetical protein [Roseomonas sp. OT10]
MTHDAKVVRFPLLRALPAQEDAAHATVPDVRVVLQVAEAFQLETPWRALREQTEAAVTAHVEASVPPERGARREAALRDLLADYTNRATAARQVSDEAWAAAEAAQARVVELSQHRGDSGMEVLRRRADEMSGEAARLLLEAYELSVQASAAATVVGLARRGEAWRPWPAQAVDDLSWAQPVQQATVKVSATGRPGG